MSLDQVRVQPFSWRDSPEDRRSAKNLQGQPVDFLCEAAPGFRIAVVFAHAPGPFGEHGEGMPMGDSDHGVQQMVVAVVKISWNKSDSRPLAIRRGRRRRQRPGQTVAAKLEFPRTRDGTGSLHPGEPGISGGGGPPMRGALGGYPHRPAIFASGSIDGTTGCRVPTCIVPVVVGPSVSFGASGIRESHGQVSQAFVSRQALNRRRCQQL